ncbi:MAG TPA: hypothetical protein VNE17_06980 [Nitrolancea sp.]|nr:hypothetical protein [Nitrolancea sp.]
MIIRSQLAAAVVADPVGWDDVVPPDDEASELPPTNAGAGATAAAEAAVADSVDPLVDDDLSLDDEPQPPTEHALTMVTETAASTSRKNRCIPDRFMTLAPLNPRTSHISHPI